MPYSHTTFGQLKTELSLRLYDANKVFWVDQELGLYIIEALRTFGLCSGFWRERGTFDTAPAAAFYDLRTALPTLLEPTVTDQDIILQLQYHLLETKATVSQSSWLGTEMFTFEDIWQGVQNRLNQFLADTGIVVQRSLQPVIAPPEGRQPLDQSIIDVRRVVWIGAPYFSYFVWLAREDELGMTMYSQLWSVNSDIPISWSIMAPPPLQLQLSPVPITDGQVELLTVNSVNLTPWAGPTVLGIPDALSPAIKWGALADLMGNDGVSRDPVRAEYAERRYREYVELARMLPVVIHGEINGVPLVTNALKDLDHFALNWENSQAPPTDLILAAPNLVAFYPVPDGIYSATCDVVRNAPIPASDGDYLQVGREQLDMILDYAEHLALYKCAGTEWHATDRNAESFIRQSLSYNERVAASARYAFTARGQSAVEKTLRSRRRPGATGVGALEGNQGQEAAPGQGLGVRRG